MLMRVWRQGIMSRAVMKSAASSDLAAEAITNLMMWAIERTAPLIKRRGHHPRGRYKTDKSKRKGVCFWREQKLKPDRLHPDREVVLRKTDFIIFTHLISIDRYIVGLISINSNIIRRWRRLISIKINIILISTNCFSIVS
jgi:hypothetical protein